MKDPKELIHLCHKFPYIYIQTHDFPDHDAVASAYALSHILEEYNIETRLVYEGEILRDSLIRMIDDLSIPLRHISRYEIGEEDQIIIVDGSKGSSNVTDLLGIEIAVIDHHTVQRIENVEYIDIRPSYGACSTIITGYFKELEIRIPRSIAGALMIGINIDTLHLTRSATMEDVSAYSHLFSIADNDFVNSVIRNDLTISDLDSYKYLLSNLKIEKGFAYTFFTNGCNKNLLAILSSFLITFEEIDFAVVCGKNNHKIDISVKSERRQLDAANIVSEALKGIGRGGGHPDMAGGVIPDNSVISEEALRHRFLSIIDVFAANMMSQVSSFGEDGEEEAIKITK